MKAKIKDIARYAGVSTGTVDRVIHDRGRVSSDTKNKILKAMKQLSYTPNIMARTLARKEDSLIKILLPYPYQDFYWKMIRDGIDQGLSEFSPYRLKGQTHFYDMEDPGHFNHMVKEILKEPTDVILVGSEFHQQTLNLVKTCHKKHIPCIVLNADINSYPSLSFIGINTYKAGQLVGRIIRSTRERQSILVVHNTDNINNTIHLKNKELGLIDALDKSPLSFDIDRIEISNQHHGEKNIDEIAEKIEKRKIDTIYFTTSKVYQFAASLKSRFQGLYIIGHDLIDHNIRMMEQGHVNLIIDQSGYKVGYLSVKSWVDYHIFEREIPAKQYLPLHIVYPENLPANRFVQ